MSMTVGIDLQADLKNWKVRVLASSRFTELGGTLTALIVKAIVADQSLGLKLSSFVENGRRLVLVCAIMDSGWVWLLPAAA